MALQSACPSADQLEQIMRGNVEPTEVERIAQHVKTCPDCEQTLQTLKSDGTLAAQVRAEAGQIGKPLGEAVQKLMEQMRRNDPRSKATAESAVEQTVDAAPHAAGSSVGGTGQFSWVESPHQTDDEEDDGLAPPQAADEIGRLGPYRVLKVLGEGGMGKVFLAEDPALQRRVALKVMKKSLAVVRKSRERFILEARAAAKIDHDNIIPIYQVGEDRNVPFVAMPLLKGSSLEDMLRRIGALQIKQVLRIGIQIAEGLAAAHENNLIHRDIKPGNIWIEPTGGGRVRILDFGLARSTQGDAGITQSGAILGTPAYMPPEQARGEKVDHRADLYSLGCVLYRMSTGEMPLKGNDTMSLLVALATQEPIAPTVVKADVPQGLSDLIMQLMSKDSAKRPISAAETAQALRSLERGESSPSVAAPPAAVVPAARAIATVKPPNPFANLRDTSEPVKPLASPVRGKGAGTPLPSPSARGDGAESVRRRSIALIACIAAAFLLLVGAGGVIYRFAFQTADGTLLVEVDKDADVRFKNGKLEIRDTKGNLLYTLSPSEKNKRLPPGDYLIDVVGADGLTVSTKEFSLTKNGEKSVRVSVAPAAQRADATPISPAATEGTYALSFGKTGSYVAIPTLAYNGGPITLEARIHPDPKGTAVVLAGGGKGSVSLFTGGVHGLGFSVGEAGKGLSADWGKWPNGMIGGTHIAGVWDGKEIKCFVDGKFARQDVRQEYGKEFPGFFIGGPPGYDSFEGTIAEVRISKIARYNKGFTPAKRFETDANTIALYHCDEGSGDVLKDSSGNNHHGKIVGAKWVKADGSPTSPPPPADFALRFNNAPDVVTVPTLALDLAAPYTMEGYFKQTEFGAGSQHVIRWPVHASLKSAVSTTHRWNFQLPKADKAFAIVGSPVVLDQTVHVAAVSDTNQVRLYVNGTLVAHKDISEEKFATSKKQGFQIGHEFNGVIGEVRISKVARYDKNFTPAKRLSQDADTLALYHCDEGAGDKLTDSSGNGHHGKIVGAKWVKVDGTPIAPAAPPWHVNSLGMKLAYIPPGKFTMGSSKQEIEHCLNLVDDLQKQWVVAEGPEHPVEITRPFYLGTTMVTVGQFRQFLEANPKCDMGEGRWKSPGFKQSDEHPVIYVSWHNAVDFCKWLSAKEGKKYRLPTEAEWEYACRAGKYGTRYFFGNDEAQLADYAWHGHIGAAPGAYVRKPGPGTMPVASKKTNPWGLYDVHGNAYQWCQDAFDPNYYQAGPAKDPQGGVGEKRIIRGGAWDIAPARCLCASRMYYKPDFRGFIGLRVVLEADGATAAGIRIIAPVAPPPAKFAIQYSKPGE